MRKYRVLLVDDHSILRAGLASLFDDQPDFTVIAQAQSLRQLHQLLTTEVPDLVCLDVSLPDGSGLTAIKEILTGLPFVKILVLTSHDDPAYAQTAFAAGAHGYMLKHSPPAELFTALRAMMQGRMVLDPNITAVPARSAARGPDLSTREQEVIRHLAAGLTNQQAADRMFLSVKTVETYRARLTQKLGFSDRSALVRYAIEMGLLDLPKSSE